MVCVKYCLSRKATQPLTEAILNQKLTLSPEETHEMNQKTKHAKNGISSEKTLYNKYKLASIKAKCTDDISRNLQTFSARKEHRHGLPLYRWRNSTIRYQSRNLPTPS